MKDPDLTRLLQDAANGSSDAAEQLLPAIYEQMRQMARRHLHGDRATIEPTALVHEAWLRVSGEHASSWSHRGHFFRAASQAMRRVLVDHARRRQAKKRAPAAERATVSDVAAQHVDFAVVLDIHEALDKLEAERPREAQVVLMRYFGGLEMSQIAAALEVSLGTAERDWRLARARLQRWLDEGPKQGPDDDPEGDE